jgi:hypothetical protein
VHVHAPLEQRRPLLGRGTPKAAIKKNIARGGEGGRKGGAGERNRPRPPCGMCLLMQQLSSRSRRELPAAAGGWWVGHCEATAATAGRSRSRASASLQVQNLRLLRPGASNHD